MGKPSVFEVDNLFRLDRPVMMESNRCDLVGLWRKLVGEVGEGEEEIMAFVLGHKNALEKIVYEMADIILFAAEIIRCCARDPEEVIREKVARNILKRPAKLYSNGRTMAEAEAIAVPAWKATKGDEEFFGYR